MNESILDYAKYFQFPGLTALFTTKSYPYSPPDDRIKLARIAGLNPDQLVIPKQTHTHHVEVVNKPGHLPDTDGIITADKNIILTIQVADCIPIFFADSSSHTIGLIHAGWRGVTKGIILQMTANMKNRGVHFATTQIVLGPSIRKCCFEVKDDVLHNFPAQYQYQDKQGRYWIDLHTMVVDQLIEKGFKSQNIIDINQCTKCKSDEYHSYRQEGNAAGRMIGLMAMK
ncbi:MAG: peptidoglycan editing factor PgeF [Simkaniaceae bacterium]|nr:peptidoglycan editing factor PgeF [Simkaniaceae bacterium]